MTVWIFLVLVVQKLHDKEEEKRCHISTLKMTDYEFFSGPPHNHPNLNRGFILPFLRRLPPMAFWRMIQKYKNNYPFYN